MSTVPNVLAYMHDRTEFIILQFSCPDCSREGKRIRVYVPATKLQKAAYESYVRSMIGTPYDLKSIFGIALNSNLHDQGHLICSAFGKLAVDDKPPGIVIVRKTYYLTSPEDLRIATSATYGAIEQRIEGNGPVPPLELAFGASA
jgi:hypothetical protein